jgi:hypothetical protein
MFFFFNRPQAQDPSAEAGPPGEAAPGTDFMKPDFGQNIFGLFL